VSSSEIDLSWRLITSTAGIAGYNIYEVLSPDAADVDDASNPDQLLGRTSDSSTTTFKLTGLDSDTAYQFYVAARDVQGNLTKRSAPVIETTLEDSSATASSTTDTAAAVRLSSNTAACIAKSTFPYCSPFGDKSASHPCRKNQTGSGTPAVYMGCVCQPTTDTTCIGSCVDSSVNTDIGCRPGGTYDDYGYDNDNNKYIIRKSAVISSAQDQGVDYSAAGDGHVGHTSAYMYAMGKGKIINIITGITPARAVKKNGKWVSNGKFGPNWIVYKLNNNRPNRNDGSDRPPDGLKVYIAEYCTLASNAVKNVLTGEKLGHRWHEGDLVNANSILCTMDAQTAHDETINGQIYWKYRGLEIGWADESVTATTSGPYPKASSCYSNQPYGHVPTQFGYSFSQFIRTTGGPKGKPVDGSLRLFTDPNTGLHFVSCPKDTKANVFPSDYKGDWYNFSG
jgi:hypothetical protein